MVTGATGFIGRRLVRRLVQVYGADAVTCLVYERVDTDAERAGRALIEALGTHCIPVDLVTAAGLDRAPKGSGIVFHLASNIDTGAPDHRIDDLGTRNLLEAIGPLGRGSRFVFTSSIAVTDHREARDEPANEHTPLRRPYNEYGRRKLLAEAYLCDRAAEQGFSLVIARLCTVYGNGTRDSGIFGQIGAMTRNEGLVARLDYPGKISLIYVEDIIEILMRLARQPMAAGESRITMPVAEVLTLSEMIAASFHRHGKRYRPICMPRVFWRLCNQVAYQLFRLEPALPHWVCNRLWQLGLTVTNMFYLDAASSMAQYPDLKLRRFRDSLNEVW